MAESRGELEVYNGWFAAADLDRDGVLSGLEAVQFFQRSGLPQNPTLFKVAWAGMWGAVYSSMEQHPGAARRLQGCPHAPPPHSAASHHPM